MKNKSLNKKFIKEVKNLHPINKTDNDWLDRLYRKSKSDRSRTVAQTSLKAFDVFCKNQGVQKHPYPEVKYSYIPKISS